ncbi:MAG TPA: HAMP domain-containing sensor histidine kinase [Flavobacteriaceae bacterium]|nr:HAMP domain-containing sensor histidine kinase [Flavobacteriaceae bacterium]
MSFSIKAKLEERVKELSCLYSISGILTAHQGDLNETFRLIAHVVKNAWLYSDEAMVVITYQNLEIETNTLPEETFSIQALKELSNKKEIVLQVHYPAEGFSQSSFLEEEVSLLNQVATDLAEFLNNIILKEKEAQLQRSLERNDRLALVGEITAGIAHELNTPLANILGFAELLEDKITNKAHIKDVNKIIKSAIYAREVVKKLMLFTCDLPQNKSIQQLRPLIEEAVAYFSPNLKKAEVTLETHFENKTLSLRVDRVQFMQLLFNLLSNALYVSAPGSSIIIKLRETQEFIFLEVADQGPGIPQELKTKIFEPFYSTKPPGQGSGLGLSVVHGIVKSHKGNIEIKENQPKGTIFSLQFPKES